MREVSALPRHTPTVSRKDISTLLKHGLIILVTTIDAIEVRVPCTVFHLSFSEFS